MPVGLNGQTVMDGVQRVLTEDERAKLWEVLSRSSRGAIELIELLAELGGLPYVANDLAWKANSTLDDLRRMLGVPGAASSSTAGGGGLVTGAASEVRTAPDVAEILTLLVRLDLATVDQSSSVAVVMNRVVELGREREEALREAGRLRDEVLAERRRAAHAAEEMSEALVQAGAASERYWEAAREAERHRLVKFKLSMRVRQLRKERARLQEDGARRGGCLFDARRPLYIRNLMAGPRGWLP